MVAGVSWKVALRGAACEACVTRERDRVYREHQLLGTFCERCVRRRSVMYLTPLTNVSQLL